MSPHKARAESLKVGDVALAALGTSGREIVDQECPLYSSKADMFSVDVDVRQVPLGTSGPSHADLSAQAGPDSHEVQRDVADLRASRLRLASEQS